jgi:ketosteroid isomerase-like protein
MQFSFLIFFFFIVQLNQVVNAQLSADEKEKIKAQIVELNRQEREAFTNGDCDKVISFFDKNVSFYANGRKAPSLEFIHNFCNRIKRPFEKGAEINDQVTVLSETVANNVKFIELPLKTPDDKTRNVEVVTRIWNKTSEGWKIVHFHSSVTTLPVQ